MPADLKVIDAEPLGAGVKERLEHVMELASKGEISSLAIAWVNRDGSPGWRWSHAPNTSTLIGAIERLKIDMIVQKDA